ncbi:MAG TPA: glycosyltransferase family 39 protein [Magnetospirillum sp.]|nr:glycosyltransferase family 39 protein [Magnetospirillum sp.]
MHRLTGGLRPYLALSLLCLALFLPGLAAMPPMDRDESRFIQATRQMLESGDYIRIQFQQEMRAKKPAGTYWLQAAAVKALSHPLSTQVWPYRLPSALAAWAAVLMTFAFGRSLVGERPALLGGVMLAASLMLVLEAHQGKSDAILLACVVAAQGTLARFYVSAKARETQGGGGGCGGSHQPMTAQRLLAPGTSEALVFWLAQGAAILVKGPVVPVISLLTVAALWIADRNARWFVSLKPLLGTAVTAAIAAPWFVAISSATGGAFVGEAVKGDLLPKLLGAQESHGGFPGLYLLLASALFWPGSLLLWPAVAKLWGQRGRLAFRVLLAWAVPTWIMFELIPTKLPHYVLPAFPALALMVAALACEGLEVFRHKAAKAWYAVWTLIGFVLAAAMVVAPIKLGNGFEPLTVPAAIGIVLATLLPAVLAWRGQVATAALTLALTSAATFPVALAGVVPSLDKMFLSRGVARIVATIGSDGPVAAAGYSEPSLVFLLGTDTRFVTAEGAAAYLAAHRRALAVVNDRDLPAFFAAAQSLNLETEEFGRADGLNYSRGKPTTLVVLGVKTP